MKLLKKKSTKITLALILSYVILVILFESLLGYFQPENVSTLQIATQSDDGQYRARIVARLESDGRLYVAANHWPRSWYRDALANPLVQVDGEQEQGDYNAVPVSGAEHERVDDDNSLPLLFRLLTGFPPRYFLRLEPAR